MKSQNLSGVTSESFRVIGIDVSKDTLEVCFSPDFSRFEAGNDEEGILRIAAFAKKEKADMLLLEATGGYEIHLVTLLSMERLPVVVMNPRRIRKFAEALGFLVKTDKIDAAVIAAFGVQVRPPIRSLPEEKYSFLSQLIDRRRQLKEMLTMEQNRLSPSIGDMRKNVEQHILYLEKGIEKAEKRIRDEIEKSPIWKQKSDVMQTVKGVGPVLSSTFLAILPELGTLSKKKISALVGVCPYNRESGQWRGKSMIFGGRRDVRSVLYMSTMVACKYNPTIKAFHDRLLKEGKLPKVALVACMHKLLIILNAMIKNNTPWRSPVPVF
jgi:transposase